MFCFTNTLQKPRGTVDKSFLPICFTAPPNFSSDICAFPSAILRIQASSFLPNPRGLQHLSGAYKLNTWEPTKALPACLGGHGNALQDSCLENPTDRGDCWASVLGVVKSQTRLKRASTRETLHQKPQRERQQSSKYYLLLCSFNKYLRSTALGAWGGSVSKNKELPALMGFILWTSKAVTRVVSELVVHARNERVT